MCLHCLYLIILEVSKCFLIFKIQQLFKRGNQPGNVPETRTLPFWLETSLFWQVFPASCFRLIYSSISLFNQSF